MTRKDAAQILHKAKKEAARRERLRQLIGDNVRKRGTPEIEIKGEPGSI